MNIYIYILNFLFFIQILILSNYKNSLYLSISKEKTQTPPTPPPLMGANQPWIQLRLIIVGHPWLGHVGGQSSPTSYTSQIQLHTARYRLYLADEPLGSIGCGKM